MINPFEEVINKRLTLHPETGEVFKNKTVIITGGVGFVGSHLKQKLYELGAKRIITIDIAFGADYRAYVSSPSILQIFRTEKPDYCFHLAAERLPNKAEENPYQAIRTNIEGTRRVIHACDLVNAKLIFSSTGKASRLATKDVYASTKKIAEWLVNQSGLNQKAIVRFTHIIENSPVTADIRQKVQDWITNNNPVVLHAPDRYVTAQNVSEAVTLLLNAAAISNRASAVAKLEWPISVDEILIYISSLRCTEPQIRYSGVPAGYEEYVFAGQLNPIFPLVNPLERIVYNNDAVYFDLLPIDKALLDIEITPENLNQVVYDCALSSLKRVNPFRLLDVLEQGVKDPNYKPDFVSKLLQEAIAHNTYYEIKHKNPLVPFLRLAFLSTNREKKLRV
jgi:dTDP-4-dehydrorhamnose reductase